MSIVLAPPRDDRPGAGVVRYTIAGIHRAVNSPVAVVCKAGGAPAERDGVERSYEKWFSPSLGREMELLVFGHGGAAVLVFPTSMGRFYQYEDFGMVEALRGHLDRGWIQLFCLDGVDHESWYNWGARPRDRAARHEQYERYILDEALPFVRHRNRSGFLTLTGNSFGAYHAANLALRHPGLADRVVAISGAYNVPGSARGLRDQGVYYNSPVDYLPNLQDERYLAPLRRLQLHLIVGGPGDICHEGTLRLAGILGQKGLPHTLDIWESAWHDWPWWRQMILTRI